MSSPARVDACAHPPVTCDHPEAVPVQPQQLTPDVIDYLAHAYRCRELSTRQIAAEIMIDRQRVNRWLSKAGIPVRPRGAGRRRPHQRRPDPPEFPALLETLYVQQRLTSAQIGDLLGIPERRVRLRLKEFGITRRPRGGHDRADRLAVPRATLIRLYVLGGMTGDEIARRVGMSRNAVLRTAHDLGLPVRTGGAPPTAGPADIRLIEALYADSLVHQTLQDHGIPRAAPGGAIWQRFPIPVAAPSDALIALYDHCGLSTRHIELLTGIPAVTVGRRLRDAGVELRRPGGRCPFLRRWREASLDDDAMLESRPAGPRGAAVVNAIHPA